MSLFPNDGRMQPILILPKGSISKEDIDKLNKNGICTVEADNPALIKFLDPIPSAAERTKTEDAAIEFSRKILNKGYWTNDDTRADMAKTYVELLVRGTRLDPRPSQAEQELEIFDDAKRSELQRLAREEAKTERLAAKAAAATAKAKESKTTTPVSKS